MCTTGCCPCHIWGSHWIIHYHIEGVRCSHTEIWKQRAQGSALSRRTWHLCTSHVWARKRAWRQHCASSQGLSPTGGRCLRLLQTWFQTSCWLHWPMQAGARCLGGILWHPLYITAAFFYCPQNVFCVPQVGKNLGLCETEEYIYVLNKNLQIFLLSKVKILVAFCLLVAFSVK